MAFTSLKQKNGLLKGFIGPLGDDIPSIFPIVFSVLLFTGSVIYANQMISEKAKAIEIREGAMALSYLVTDKGFVEWDQANGKTSLEKVCEEKIKPRAASLNVKFLITLKRFCKGIPSSFDWEQVDSVSPPSYPEDLNPYHQSSAAEASVEKTNPFFLSDSSSNNELGSTWFYCSNAPEIKTFSSPGLFPQPKNSIILSYPIAVPCNPDNEYINKPDDVTAFTNGLGVVNVITWK